MIAGVTLNIAGSSQTLRMTMRAMMAIEDVLGKPITEIAENIEEGFSATMVAQVLQECLKDGAGGSVEEVSAVVDHIGMFKSAEILAELIEGAFPGATEAGKAADGKNRKRAAKRK